MNAAPPPDLLLIGGTVHPLGGLPPGEALLLREGRVAALGEEAEVRAATRPGVRVVDLGGAVATPGLTDAHLHPTAWALGRRRLDLHSARTPEEAVARLRTAAGQGGGEWLRGQGWDANRWGGFPDRQMLDAAVPDRPVVLESHDLHALWVNTEALRRCAIDAATPDPPGGRIVRDAAGAPTGVLLEHAARLVVAHLPEPTPAEVQTALTEAQAELHRLGITGVHSVEPTGLADFGRMIEVDRLRLRVLQAVPLVALDAALAVGLRSGFGGPWLRVGGVKMFLDGALGSRTALLREPYEGSTDRGVETLASGDFRDAVRRAAEGGIATTVHAIGDAAVERALDVLGAVPAPPSMPHRIEHLQLCPPELWERAGRSGITLSMQPVHLRSDVPAAERHWGHARSRGAYAFGALLAAGGRLAFGSDAPVETADPRQGLYAAVRRAAWDDTPTGGWFPEHALTAEQALRAYTEGPARAAGEWPRRGRLAPGCDADLVVWDRDPLAIPAEELLEMRCVLAVVGGEIVYTALGDWGEP